MTQESVNGNRNAAIDPDSTNLKRKEDSNTQDNNLAIVGQAFLVAHFDAHFAEFLAKSQSQSFYYAPSIWLAFDEMSYRAS
jgi:hypothetical protein